MYDLTQYVKKFKESEVENVSLANFDVKDLIEKHEKAIEILEAIEHFKRRKKMSIEMINGFQGTFPRLRAKLVNRVDTINRCIKRLEERYGNI